MKLTKLNSNAESSKSILCGLLLALIGVAVNGYGQEVDIRTDKRYGGLVAAWNFDGDTNEFLSGDKLKSNKGEVIYTMDRNLEEAKALLVQKGQFLSGLNELLPQGDSPRTVMFWMRKTGCGDADIALLQFGNNTKPRGMMNIRVRPCAEWGGYMTTSFVPDLEGRHKYTDALRGDFFNEMWKHITITYSRGIVSIYCDAFPVKKYSPSSSGAERADTASAEIAMGWVTNPDGSDDTVICLDEVRVFESKLNVRRINLIYKNELSIQTGLDSDGDQLDDLSEVFIHGTDPSISDTDGDGLSDGDELIGSKEWYWDNIGRYQIILGDFNWHEAKEDAESRGGHLATITSEAENANIFDLVMHKFSEMPCLWLGASDKEKEGHWKWVSGESWDYSNWHEGEPNNDSGDGHYLQIWGSAREKGKVHNNNYELHFTWNDIRIIGDTVVDTPVGYIIEFPTNPLDKDSDDDGYLDGEEIRAKTNPDDATSFPSASNNVRITNIQKVPFGISFQTNEGSVYEFQASGDLKKWSTLQEVKGTGSEVKVLDLREALFQKQYYRVKLVE